jgi:hypothetical protein
VGRLTEIKSQYLLRKKVEKLKVGKIPLSGLNFSWFFVTPARRGLGGGGAISEGRWIIHAFWNEKRQKWRVGVDVCITGARRKWEGVYLLSTGKSL